MKYFTESQPEYSRKVSALTESLNKVSLKVSASAESSTEGLGQVSAGEESSPRVWAGFPQLRKGKTKNLTLFMQNREV